jgi:hypothetical protein
MADWFETRFRDPADGGHPDAAFAARVRALVVEEWRGGAGWSPPEDTDADDHEGDIIMLETEDRPAANEPPAPTRRPPARWLLAAAAVAVLAVVGAVLAAGGDEEDKIDTVTSVPTGAPPQEITALPEGLEFLEPGPYFIDPDGDPATSLRVVYDVAAEGWSPWIGAVKSNPNDSYVGLSITTVTNLTRDACHDWAPLDPPVGPTVDDLATALTLLAPFEVTSPPSDVTVFGYSGKHVQLTVPADLPTFGPLGTRRFSGCAEGELHTWFAPNLGGSFWGYNGNAGLVEDFWILDVDGTRLVLETGRAPESPPQDVIERDAIFDSIRIEP